ncbi:AMP-binding protein [Actinomycetospora chiangmaiensis]|uniref:AMP-binding protein n=1 Tax=Actinomycetospora chiangmaiensis TaxID=402650 RepID=UPI00035E2E2D|nr:AMP-binding protein [Actinomycetospora chiangmaiensis]
MTTAATTRSAPAFVTGLRGHGDRTAVITADGALTYAELADRVDEAAAALAGDRRLVLVAMAATVPALVAYLGALRAGHVVLLAPAADPATTAELTRAWRPDVVVDGALTTTGAAGPVLHEDLTLLLATSGSTGSPRLVRLTASALDANAAAIADFLDVRPTDRAATTLPLHYCYGLSVVHANLLGGAALLLTDASVTAPAFWDAVREHAVTSLHGVPHTFALLERAGIDLDLPHLRYVTQAGGRLAPDEVRRWAARGAAHGWRFVVMYGQTEATARMAWLPPELAASAPEAIGRPIPGGALRIDDPDADGVGEIVYSGPNVMLGYAETSADLALGRTVTELRTGDLGRRRPDGLFEVTGRRSRFVKPFGVRVDLDAVESFLAARGHVAAVTGDDTGLVVAVEGRATTAVHGAVTARLHLPDTLVSVVGVDALPRRANGKLDHPAVAALARRPEPSRRRVPAVREVFARTFPGQVLDDDATFVDLGGDSLTYVQVSADLERALGHLPDRWDTTPLGELAARTPVRRSRWADVESAVVLRALAIVLVVGEHDHLWTWLGGAHLLLAIAGWTFARFVLSGGDGVTARVLRSAALVAVPSSLWILGRSFVTGSVQHQDALLLGGVFHPLVQGYWFVDALVQILVGAALLLAVPAVRRFERRRPFAFPAIVLAASLALWAVPSADPTVPGDLYSTHLVLWLFVLGWMLQRASTPAQRWATALVTIVLVTAFFGVEYERAAVVAGGLLVLLCVARVRIPRPLVGPVTAIAGASLGIYLTHFALLGLADVGVPPAALVVLGLVVGIVTWRLGLAAVRLGVRAPTIRRVPSRR